MRVKRLKHCKKHVSFYKNNFGFHQPYQILVDLTFCQTALNYKINIKEQVPKYIDGESQLFTTRCIMHEGKLLGAAVGGAVHIGKQFKFRKCGHEAEPLSAQDCILSMIGESNAFHFFVASQDTELRGKLRKLPGVPLLHINYNALVLEKPSKSSELSSRSEETRRAAPAAHEHRELQKMKTEISEEEPELKPKRKKKNPNPLSVKKKTKTLITNTGGEPSKQRRKRKHKIAQHVIDALREKQEGACADIT